MSFIDCVHKSPWNPQPDVVHSFPIESEVPKGGPGHYLVSAERSPDWVPTNGGLRALQGQRAPSAWPSALHFHRRDMALTFPRGSPGRLGHDRTVFGSDLSFPCHSIYTVRAGVCLPVICWAASMCQAPPWQNFQVYMICPFYTWRNWDPAIPTREAGARSEVSLALKLSLLPSGRTALGGNGSNFRPSLSPHSCNFWILCIWNFSLALGSWS